MRLMVSLLLLFNTPVFGQAYPGPRAMAFGGAASAARDIFSTFRNPAGLATLPRAAVEFSYVRHLMIDEYSTKTALLVLPYRSNVIGLGFQSHGIEQFHEQTTALAYSRTLGDQLSLGISFYYHSLNVLNYGQGDILSVAAGLQATISPWLMAGAYIFNPSEVSSDDQNPVSLPMIMAVGVSCLISSNAVMYADLERSGNRKVHGRAGLEYRFAEWLQIRAGLSSTPLTPHVGFGIVYQGFTLQTAFSSDLNLGLTPQFSVGYEF